MDLSYSEDQIMLRDSATRFLAQRYSPTNNRSAMHAENGSISDIWREFAELGWLALPISEDHGGIGGSPADIAILMEAFGQALVTEPYLTSSVLCSRLIASRATLEQQGKLLPLLASGEQIYALAHLEVSDAHVPDQVETHAAKNSDGWVLNGTKSIVSAAPLAQALLVSARIDGAGDAVGLFIVPTLTTGLELTGFPTLDGSQAANVVLTNVQVGRDALLGDTGCARDDIELAYDHAIAAAASDAVGAMRALLDATVDYTKQRQQFGRPLAGNQVVRHRLADMALAVEEAQAAALRATLMLDTDASTRARAISSTKLKVGATARFVAEQAVQLHGGMGVTDELNIGAYFKRLLAFEIAFGDADYHHDRHLRLAPCTAASS